MTYVKIGGTLYPATVSGKVSDKDWDNRASKAITLKENYSTVDALFTDGTVWSIVMESLVPMTDEQGQMVYDENGDTAYTTELSEFENSEYNIRGDLTSHTNGTCTVKMGKATVEELLQAQLGQAVSIEEYETAYTEGVNSI